MLVELSERSQITIPDEITRKMGINKGDKFEIVEQDGGLFLVPVVVYPTATLERLTQIIEGCKNDTSLPIYNTVAEMFNDLGIDFGDSDV